MTIEEILAAFAILIIITDMAAFIAIIFSKFHRKNGSIKQPLKRRLLVSYLKYFNNL